MTLIFVYIEGFRSLKDVNFNLGGKFRFEYNAVTKKLNAKANPVYLNGFYDIIEERQPGFAIIDHVAAIVGENGTGKTTFLDFIKENFPDGVGGFRARAIFAYQNSKTQAITIYRHKLIDIDRQSISDLTENNISLHDYGPKKIISHNKKLRELLDITQQDTVDQTVDTDYVYLSNIFDKKYENEFGSLHNLSTNYLLRNDSTKLKENNLNLALELVEQHRSSEIHREMDFINAFQKNFKQYLDFELPDKINAYLLVQVEYRKNKNLFEERAYYYLRALEEFLQRRTQFLSTYQNFISNLFFTGISNVFNEYYKYSSEIPYRPEITFDGDKISVTDFLKMFTDILDDLLTQLHNFEYLTKKIMPLRGLVSLLDSYVNTHDNKIIEAPPGFQFQISTEKMQAEFFSFYNMYKETFQFEPYLNFDWDDRSTGEKALLNIYSRLFSLSDVVYNRTAANRILKENVMVLMDEGELYLHPTWQKELLFQLLKILPIIFQRSAISNQTKSRKIQLIFTSNSPLMITDIPSNNIVFLKKAKAGDPRKVIVQDSLNDQKQTFAANIHTLLSDSFFMDSYLMGEFAYFKINKVISLLLGTNMEIENNKEEIQKVIMMIGEPVIKSKLTQMLNDRLSLNMVDLNGRITQLERQVAGLKKDN